MSGLFAGFLALGPMLEEKIIAHCEGIRDRVSRQGRPVEVVRAGSLAVACAGTAAGSPIVLRDAERHRVTIVAGQPFLEKGSGHALSDVARLHEWWSRDEFDRTITATGTFCGLHYRVDTSELRLIADFLGLRPLFYARTGNAFHFGTAIRHLEEAPGLDRTLDALGFAEELTFGMGMEDRTRYKGIRRILPAEIVTISHAGTHRSRYARLDGVSRQGGNDVASENDVFAALSGAVRRRLGPGPVETCFLSGGLDSRAVVCLLRSQGREVEIFNFSPPGSQDRSLARQFANAAGIRHHEADRGAIDVDWATRIAMTWQQTRPVGWDGAPDLASAWTGDGGSIGLGMVRVDPPVVSLLRQGRDPEAVDRMLREWGMALPVRLFKPQWRNRIEEAVRSALLRQLSSYECDDAGRRLHLLLMENDQRRHLDQHFETLDLHGVELLTPFYDAILMRTVQRTPLDRLLRHQFYHDLLRLFPAEMMAVPWQTYPGHVACPLPMPPGLTYQWAAGSRRVSRARRVNGLRALVVVVGHRGLPSGLLARTTIAAAALGQATGLRAADHLVVPTLSLARFGAWEGWALDPSP